MEFGHYFSLKGIFSEANHYYNFALEIFESRKTISKKIKLLYAETLISIGYVYRMMSDNLQAINYGRLAE